MSELITDRKKTDVDSAAAIRLKYQELGNWSGLTQPEVDQLERGTYTHNSMTRVATATVEVAERLTAAGYPVELEETAPEPTSRLPEGYVELEWIESTGTQYIDTNYVPNGSSKIELDVQLTNVSSNAGFFCARNAAIANDSTSNTLFYIPGSNGFRFDYYGNSIELSYSVAAGTRLAIEQDAGTLKINSQSKVFSKSSRVSPESWLLFASGSATADLVNNFCIGKLFVCRIWDSADVLVRDFVPCKNPSGAVGLYDLVGGQFYGNSGSGAFVAGEEIIPEPVGPIFKTEWSIGDIVTMAAWRTYIGNVARCVEGFVPMGTPELPDPEAKFDFEGANALEKCLAMLNEAYESMVASYRKLGTFQVGANAAHLPLRR